MPWYRCLVVALLLLVGLTARSPGPRPATPGDVLVVSASVTNAQGKGIKDAEPRFFVNGEAVTPASAPVTDSNGTFEARLELPAGTLPAAQVEMSVERPSYKPSARIALGQIHPEQTTGPATAPMWRMSR